MAMFVFPQSSKRFFGMMLALLVFILTASQATQGQSPVRIGLSATPLVSWHRPDNAAISNAGARMGFQYGMLVDVALNESGRYALATGALVTMAGGSLEDNTNLVFSVNDVNRLQYIEVPVMFRLTATELNYYRFYGVIGMVPGVNIRARGDRSYDPVQILIPAEVNRKIGNANLLNVGLEVGGGVEYDLAEHLTLSAGLVYRNGFVNIYDDGDNDKITLNHVALNVAVFF
ncbi:MAG: outer membrane beta-barrel protein [Bacteroidetes bacterium]|nr:outer membrane beta-barrel protein [Bacteroidota bacterium]